MNARSATSYAVVGAGLIAMSYGLARFAFGLFVPQIRSELGLTAEVMGVVSAMAFVSFALASLFAATVAERLGPSLTGITASGLGVGGLVTISLAGGPVPLALGVFACGICTGLMMPALSAGLGGRVAPPLQGRVTAIMNAGTSFGVAVSVPTAFVLANAWRSTYLAFAALAAACLLAAWRFLPARGRRSAATPGQANRVSPGQRLDLARLGFFAFGMGMASAIYWVFTPDMIVAEGRIAAELTGWLWLALGVAGLAGAAAGDTADRYGAGRAQSVALLGMTVALLTVTLFPGQLLYALLSAGLFGIAYMMLTAIYVISGIRLVPDHPALGPVVPFLAVAVGQAVGSPLAGVLVTRFGYDTAFLAFAIMALAVAACLPLFPQPRMPRVT